MWKPEFGSERLFPLNNPLATPDEASLAINQMLHWIKTLGIKILCQHPELPGVFFKRPSSMALLSRDAHMTIAGTFSVGYRSAWAPWLVSGKASSFTTKPWRTVSSDTASSDSVFPFQQLKLFSCSPQASPHYPNASVRGPMATHRPVTGSLVFLPWSCVWLEQRCSDLVSQPSLVFVKVPHTLFLSWCQT